MKSPCDRLAALLAASPEAAAALPTLEAGLSAHATTCPRCQDALARSEALVRGLATLHVAYEPAPDLAASVVARAHRKTTGTAAAPRPAPTRGLIFAALGGAAATAVVVALVSSTSTSPSPTNPTNPAPGASAAVTPGTPATAPTPTPAHSPDAPLHVTHCMTDQGEAPCSEGQTLTTPVGQARTFRLSDRTLLTLDQDSTLTLAAGRALTVLRGEARLDVTQQPDLPPLDVTLPTGTASVIGTELLVRAGESLSVVEVSRGLVAVSGDGHSHNVRAGQSAWLRPGRSPVVRSATPAPVLDPNDAANAMGTDLGFGTLSARRPGAKTDADRPLRLSDHKVDVRIQGAFSRTIIEEAFASDEPHELEGVYRFTLPPNAQVAELSLLVDGRWEEGAFVDRDRAERIWAGVIRQATPVIKRREIIEYIWVPGPWKDPALLSWKQGNTFELRIFPIPARGERKVRIAYTETLPLVAGARRYTLPLPSDGSNIRAERFGLDLRVGTEIPRKDIRIRNYKLTEADEETVRFTNTQTNFRPTGDLVVDVPEPDGASDLTAIGWGSDNGPDHDAYLALMLRPALADLDAAPTPIDLVVLVDTSYGIQKARLDRAADLTAELIGNLSPDDSVQVLACATTCRPLGAFAQATPDLATTVRDRLARLETIGSTRLSAAFADANAAFARKGSPAERRRIVYLGDGIQSVGELDGPRVVASLRNTIGDTRVTSISLGGETDPVVLTNLAKTHGGSFLDASALGSVKATAQLAARRQRALPLTNVVLELPEGLHAVAPVELGDLWPGDERLVTARVARGTDIDQSSQFAGELVLRGKMGDEPVERRWRFEASLQDRPGHAFVPRLWAIQRIADLSTRDDEAARKEVVGLSETHHVLSRHTSLLVLESPAMAKAFGVETTRPVAHWDGEAPLDLEESQLLGALGGVETAGGRAGDGGGAFSELDSVADLDGFDSRTETKRDLNHGKSGAADKALTKPSAGAPIAVPADPAMNREDSLRDERMGRRRPPSGGEWVPMKKVWYKEAAVAPSRERTDTWAERQLELRETALDQSPDSRERTMAVVRTLLRLRELDRAERLTIRWLERDRMDPEALLTLADIAALNGDMVRSEALIASAIEADPRQPTAHLRLARLYETAGNTALACEHKLSRALTARTDAAAQVEAMHCGVRSDRLLIGLEPAFVRKVERAFEAAQTNRSRVAGPFRLDATWEGNADLDVLVIDPDGRVISWLGGADLNAADVSDTSREQLAFRGNKNGRWQVLVVRRPAASARSSSPDAGQEQARPSEEADSGLVSGAIRVTAHGVTRRMPFTLDAEVETVFVADIEVKARFRYEPL